MEEILASIRRIISDGEETAQPPAADGNTMAGEQPRVPEPPSVPEPPAQIAQAAPRPVPSMEADPRPPEAVQPEPVTANPIEPDDEAPEPAPVAQAAVVPDPADADHGLAETVASEDVDIFDLTDDMVAEDAGPPPIPAGSPGGDAGPAMSAAAAHPSPAAPTAAPAPIAVPETPPRQAADLTASAELVDPDLDRANLLNGSLHKSIAGDESGLEGRPDHRNG